MSLNMIVSNDHRTSRAARMVVPANEERNEMVFVLENITPEDQEEILRDAADAPDIQRHLLYAKKLNDFPKTWAIDRQRGCYLIFAPRHMREDSWDIPIYLRVREGIFEIRSEGQVGNRMYFADKKLGYVTVSC